MKIPEKMTGYVISILMIAIIIYLTARKLGLVDKPKSKEEKDFDKEVEKDLLKLKQAPSKFESNPYLDEDKWGEASQQKLIPVETANEYADKLRKALDSYWALAPWTWGDDENAVYGVFTSIPNLWNVSQVSDQYLKLTGVPLKEQILGDLEPDEIVTVNRILNEKSI